MLFYNYILVITVDKSKESEVIKSKNAVSFTSIVKNAQKRYSSKNKSKKKEEIIIHDESHSRNNLDYLLENLNDDDLFIEDNNITTDFEKCMLLVINIKRKFLKIIKIVIIKNINV